LIAIILVSFLKKDLFLTSCVSVSVLPICMLTTWVHAFITEEGSGCSGTGSPDGCQSRHMSALGTQLGTSARAARALNH
ncbi:hypothetical protein ACQP3F_34070, partial [Escherichia coli]